MTRQEHTTAAASSEIFLIAGEASADLHAAALLRSLKKLIPNVHCFGIGGEALRGEGMEVLFDAKCLNVVGLTDWVDKVPEVLSVYRDLNRALKKRKPALAILLDLPDFNLRMARKLKAAGIPVVYYISPQVWAWRKYRLGSIRRTVDRMLVVFPFEKEFYDRHGVSAEFVGHPLLDRIEARKQYRKKEEVLQAPRLAILPGRRKSELRFHSPLLRAAIGELLQRFPTMKIRIPIASTLALEAVAENFRDLPVELVTGDSHAVIAWADAALIASGTATLEAALIGTPFSLFYRVSSSSAWLFKYFLRYRGFIGMPNLLHGREVVREFFQEAATPEHLADEVESLLLNENYRRETAASLVACRSLLGNPGASERAAKQVFETLQSVALPRHKGSEPHVPAKVP